MIWFLIRPTVGIVEYYATVFFKEKREYILEKIVWLGDKLLTTSFELRNYNFCCILYICFLVCNLGS